MNETVSIAGIADIHSVRGADCPPGQPFDVGFEVPHGATTSEDFEALAAQLEGPLPEGLIDFFYANTDVGAWEVAVRAAELLVERAPARSVRLIRCRVPRTFVDCNRRLDATPDAFRAGGVTPGWMPWVRTPADRSLALARWTAYQRAAREALAPVRPDGHVVLLHTYAPRTVDVEVDDDIVANLRRAWAPDLAESWPLRPEIDVIGRALDGTDHTPRAVFDALARELEPRGWTVGDSATYPMHPSTVAWERVMERPGRVLCLEVRRDLLVRTWDPFTAMHVAPDLVDSIAAPLARALTPDSGVA